LSGVGRIARTKQVTADEGFAFDDFDSTTEIAIRTIR